MFPVLRPILNKGGAGRYATREETAERLNPLVRSHHELLLAYDNALANLDDGDARALLDALMPRARTESGKLSETVFSMGATPPNGTDLEPAGSGSKETDAELLYRVLNLERDYCETLAGEIDAIHHQERTRAILKVVRDGSEARLEVVRSLTNRLPQPARD
ncbi:MAG: hypothetical protein IIC18_10030 [Bacteroidetes bacterium]|nr:hypothetical protein [Bacteroidota bacterium]